MRFCLICLLLLISVQAAIAALPSRVNIDGTWYTNGQTAYIKCDKTNINVYIDLVIIPGPSNLKISVSPSSNFTVSSTPSDIMKTLNLDPSR